MKQIGQTFASELEAAGLLGLPFAWGDDGSFEFSESMTPEQTAAVQAIYDAHDPMKQLAVAPADPVVKLQEFLAANPDVAALLG